MGRGEGEQGWSRGGSSANEGRAVDGEEHRASQSTGSGSPMGQGDWVGDSRPGFRGPGECDGDSSDGSRGQGDWDGDWDGDRRDGSKGPGDGSL